MVAKSWGHSWRNVLHNSLLSWYFSRLSKEARTSILLATSLQHGWTLLKLWKGTDICRRQLAMVFSLTHSPTHPFTHSNVLART